MNTTITGSTLSTGNTEIDKKLGGGIPIGSLTLVDGQPDSGKSVLCQQILWGSLNTGHRASIFTTENTIRSLMTQMNSLNLDISDYYLLGRLHIYPVRAMREEAEPEAALKFLLELLAKEDDSVIIDSLTSFLVRAKDEQAISFFEDCKSLCNDTRTIINAVHSYALNESLLVRISSLCDAHLKLRIEIIGAQLVKILEVAKVRGAECNTGNIVSFEVEPKCGMRIIPLCQARA